MIVYFFFGYLYVSQRASIIKNEVFDFYAIENEILKLDFIDDIFISDGMATVNITLVPKKYIPYSQLKLAIDNIFLKYCMKTPTIQIVSALHYTLTGKLLGEKTHIN